MTDRAQDPGSQAASALSVSSSLLARLRIRDAEAWRRVVRLYYPLVHGWCRRAGLQDEDAADIAQEVFRSLMGNVERFDRAGGQNSFRAWLYGITRMQLLAHWRKRRDHPVAAGGTAAQEQLAEVPEPLAEEVSAVMAVSERTELLRRALTLLRAEVEERTFQAFWRAAVEGHAPADIAVDLGISVNSVYLAKARLLKRLREEFGDILDA